MNIVINFTLIVQMVHFVLAYFIVLWAFMPLSRLVKARKDQQEYLRRSVEGLEPDEERAAYIHQQRWLTFSEQISATIAATQEKNADTTHQFRQPTIRPAAFTPDQITHDKMLELVLTKAKGASRDK